MRHNVFISAVSKELISYRTKIDHWLRTSHYCEGDFQEIFPQTDQEIEHLLRDKITGCDAAIFLVGHRYGGEPSQPLPGYPRRSWTQLEYFFAREHTDRKIPVYVYLTTDDTAVDLLLDEPPELRALQDQYRHDITRDRNYRFFSSVDQLDAFIGKLRFFWETPAADDKPNNILADTRSSIGTLFKGREDFLKTLREKLTAAGHRAAAITAKQAIHGLGGVGKTQLAIEYAQQFQHEFTALLYVIVGAAGGRGTVDAAGAADFPRLLRR